MNIFAEAARLEEQNRPFALAQIVESRGSTPRHSAQMLIREDGSIVGTIGGGMVERKVIDAALEALRERRRESSTAAWRAPAATPWAPTAAARCRFTSACTACARACCWSGAGHVNRAVAHAAARVDFDICVGDIYSASLCPDAFPLSARLVHGSSFTEVVEAMAVRPQDFVLIATNNQDREALDRLITQPVAWLGLLASRRKVQAFVRQMRENGVTEADISRLRAPIGYDIGAETPNEIAISVLAEILQVKNGAPGGLMNQVRQACQPDCLAEAVEV